MTTQQWPSKLKVSPDKTLLTVEFEGGESFELPAEMLRVMSPSAEVQGHSPAERQTVPGKRDVAIIAVHPVGNYAVKITFDDMVDVLNGHELADLELGELTLLELATAYFGRACEVEMILHRGEADGSVLRNSSAYRFRTGELRDFKELCKAKMKLGQTRVYWAQQDMEPNLANVLGFGDDDD